MNADEKKRRSSACAVGPTTVEEIQKILAIANEYKLPLWAVSRGKNLGYGDPHKRVKVIWGLLSTVPAVFQVNLMSFPFCVGLYYR